MKVLYLLFLLIIFFRVSVAQTQMIANITHDIQTDFATYHPYPADFTPAVPFYTVNNDFSNIDNFSEFQYLFNSVDSSLLLQNHFTVKKSQYKQLYDIYNASTWDAKPIFVTTDAVLHIYHVFYDKMLAKIEMQRFVGYLDELTSALIAETELVYQQAKNPTAKEAARRNLAYLYVAHKLLNYSHLEIPGIISDLVDAEISLISDHDGFHFSPILGEFSMLDYSQFMPRGHYTQNDTLKAYFKTMMWYGWTIFTMEPELFNSLSGQHTLQALLFTQQLHALQNNLQLWKNIYRPTVFFVGKTDDPNINDYYNIGLQIYGQDFLNLSADSLANTSLLNAFMTEAQKLPEPLIPNWVYGMVISYKGFRFMGQRFIPDSYMFAHLVFPYVGSRLFPKGLDIMAILGSARAYTILDSVYSETSYSNYTNQIENFKAEFIDKPESDWAQNLYWNWLYCLMPLLYQKHSGYPYFMQTLAWADKELLTALASWAELRHDAILYAKQSGTPSCIPPGPPRSYVEPNPHLYARLASLVKYTRDGLQNRDLLLAGFQEKLDLFEILLLFLRDISIKELENIPLSDTEYENIFCFGKVMEKLVCDTPNPQIPWEKDSDDLAIIADVHTDHNTNRCLEEGVGYPLEIYVIVDQGGVLRITQGAIFSYYEFEQPIANRLTDELWREMLQKHEQPDLPQWVSSFMDPQQPDPDLRNFSPDNLYDKEFSGFSKEKEDRIPKIIHLSQNYPNPFNPATTIEFKIPKTSKVTLKIFNILGEEVAVLVSEILSAGSYQYQWNASHMANGLYLYRLDVGDYVETRKMVLMK